MLWFIQTKVKMYYGSGTVDRSDSGELVDDLLAKPSVYTSIGRRAFSYAAPQIWKTIPLNICISPSVSWFENVPVT